MAVQGAQIFTLYSITFFIEVRSLLEKLTSEKTRISAIFSFMSVLLRSPNGHCQQVALLCCSVSEVQENSNFPFDAGLWTLNTKGSRHE